MTRRTGASFKYIAIGAVILLGLYGLYSYHDLHSRLRTADEKVAHLGQQHDSVSAQLQVVYEHKNRLEKSLQQEKTDHQRSKDEFRDQQNKLESKHQSEKGELMGRIDSINQENKMLQIKVDDQEAENTKLKEELANLQSDTERRDTQHNEEYLQFKQEKEFEIAKLKDDLSNVARRNQEYQLKLEEAAKLQQINQGQLQQNQQQNLPQQNVFAQPNNMIPQQNNLLPQQQNSLLNQQNQGVNLLNQANQPQGVLLNQAQNQPLQNQAGLVQQAGAGLVNQQQPLPNAVNMEQKPVVDAGQQLAGNLLGGWGNPADSQKDGAMQINKPGEKKPYFEPNVPADGQPDQPAAQAVHENDADGGKLVQEQVIPPKLNGGDIGNDDYHKQEILQQHDSDLDVREKRGLEGDGLRAEGQLQEPQRIDNGGINQPNPLELNPIQAPDGVHNKWDSHVNNLDSRLRLDNIDKDNAKEEGVEHVDKLALIDVNNPIHDDKALERMDQNVEYNDEREPKDPAVDRPVLIGQGLRGGLPPQKEGNIFNKMQEEKPELLAPRGYDGGDDVADEDDHKMLDQDYDKNDYGDDDRRNQKRL